MAIVAPVLGFTPNSHTHSLTLAVVATGAKSYRYAVFPHVVCVLPVSTPWRALPTFCPWASLSPSLLSFCWVRRVHSALVDSHSCLVVPWPLSAPLSPSLASPCIHCGSWPLPGLTVPLAGSLLAPSGALESSFLFSLPLRVPLAFEIACQTRSAFPVCFWVLYPVGSSPSALVFPLWLFLFYHRVVLLWFLLSLQALVSQSTFTCLSRVCSLSLSGPSTFLG